MKNITVVRNLEMIDEDGIIRRLRITVERDPNIRIEVATPYYFDENGVRRNFIGISVPLRDNLERIDVSQMERVIS